MRNPNDGEEVAGKLNEYFQENFPVFKEAFQAEFKDWSVLPVALKLCDSMELYITLYFELTDTEKIGFLIAGKNFMTVKDDDEVLDYVKKNKSGMSMRQARYSDIKNTGLGEISDYFSNPVEILWTLLYDKDDSVHKIIADVVLEILKENVHNLSQLKQSDSSQIHEFFQDKLFLDYYIRKMHELFKHIPDHKSITNVLMSDYENRKACGTVYFFRNTSKIKKKAVCFDKECCLKGGFQKENEQRIRKLLEVCRDSEWCLVASVKNGTIIGIIPKGAAQQNKPKFTIEFDGNQWELRRGKETLLKYKSGDYYLDSANEKEKLNDMCDEADVPYDTFEKMIRLLEEKAVHGALIIIATDAEAEAKRLCLKYGRGIKIAKCKVDVQAVLGMTNADGAVFFDYDGYCYGFNIILDGIASVPGEPGRGARYNSAVNYIAYDNIKATKGNDAEEVERCAIIRSEDKEKGLTIISSDQLKKRK